MPHAHPVVDSDSRFVIDSTTRAITTSSSKSELIQGDHQSERITFEVPKLVEGHDMSLCDRIEIHYINTDKKTKATSKDVYIADDATVDGDKLTFTWLISSNATKYQGTLNFIIIFMCLDDEGNYTYKWSTEICKLLTVGASIYNSGHVVNNYSDVLETFRREVIDEATEGVVKYTEQSLTDDEKAQARENIDVYASHYGWEPLTYDIYLTPTNKLTYTRYIIEGTLIPPDYATATEEVYTAWKKFNLTARNILLNASLYVQYLEYICTLSENGIFGENFINERKKLIFANFEESNGVATVYSKTTVYFFERDEKEVLYYGVYRPPYMTSQAFIYDPQDKKITAYSYYDTLFKRSEDISAKPWVTQVLMQSAPTEDMHVATKKYVDDKTEAATSDDSLELLTETGIITPAYQNGTIYTAPTGEIYVI